MLIIIGMKKQLTLLVIALLLGSNCSDDDKTEHDKFLGNWTLTQVTQAGTVMSEWEGSHLAIERTRPDGGLYSMPDTKYDSIWSSNGTWTETTEQLRLIFDDTLTVDVYAEANKLTIAKRLPWTAQQTCDNGICLPIVTGDWTFEFERDK